MSDISPTTARAMPSIWTRFLAYLSADALTYLLGFAIYGWLIRILTDAQYGELNVATSIYQILMVVGALGLDLVGPRLIIDAGGNPMEIVARGQRVRLWISAGLCGPITAALAFYYWHHGQPGVSTVVLAGFTMVLARAFDVSYLAVALSLPASLVRTRTLGLGVYLVTLFACRPIIVRYVWIVPLLNALGVTIGRIFLLRILRQQTESSATAPGSEVSDSTMIWQGLRCSAGLILLLSLQTLDVIVLARYVRPESVGQYAMVSRLYLFATAVLACLLNSFLPHLVEVMADAEILAKRLFKFSRASIGVGILGSVAFWAAGPWVCEILGNRQLSVTRQVIPIYALVFLAMAAANPFLSFLPSIDRLGAYASGIAGAALFVGCFDVVMVPRWGPIGAALGQLIATVGLGIFSAGVCLAYMRGRRTKTQVTQVAAAMAK